MSSRESLGSDLDEIALKTSRALNRRRTQRALPRIVESSTPWLMLGPGIALFVQFYRSLDGSTFERVSWASLALWSLAPAVGYFLVRLLFSTMKPVERREALFTADKELGLEERLVTADQFLAGKEQSSFTAAAIEDAVERAREARDKDISLEQASDETSPRVFAHAAGALVLAFLAASIAPGSLEIAEKSSGETEVARAIELEERDADEPTADEESVPRLDERETKKRESSDTDSSDAPSERYSGELPEDSKEGQGKTVAGQTSEAQSGKSASNSKGQTSTQSETAKGKQSRKLPPKKKKSKSKQPKDEDPNRKQTEEPSGSTAGRGSGSGSNKNPASTDWSSKDNVESFDDEPIEDDEEVDDEESDSEARGGVQPSLRDRRPPVSRDLQIGFGNRPNPDANGRGGPSQQKKSRGVAALVLGVPIPDNVKGKPNPGKTKITQERIEPKFEESEPVQASTRSERKAPVGHLTRHGLEPWMKDLVRSYFLKLRTRQGG